MGRSALLPTIVATREARKYMIADPWAGVAATAVAGQWMLAGRSAWHLLTPIGLVTVTASLVMTSVADALASSWRNVTVRPRSMRARRHGAPAAGLVLVASATALVLGAEWAAYLDDAALMSRQAGGPAAAAVLVVAVVRVGLAPRADHRHSARLVLVSAALLIVLGASATHVSDSAATAEPTAAVTAVTGAALVRPGWEWP